MYNYSYRYWFRPAEKLTAHVSYSELMYMREHERMSNREIAERVGVSVATILKYIGKMPEDLRKEVRARA